MSEGAYDPLGDSRHPDDPDIDVFLSGTVFLDIVFTGLPKMPSAGTEVWAEGMGSCPGGIANLAIAASRLGLRTSLAAAFGDDDYADFCWRTLDEQESVDLSRSRRFEHWHSPVTVSMACAGDRSMLTHGHESPLPANLMIGQPPRSRAVICDLTAPDTLGSAAEKTRGRSCPAPTAPWFSPTWAGIQPVCGPARCWISSVTATLSFPTLAKRWPTPVRTAPRKRFTRWPTGFRSRWSPTAPRARWRSIPPPARKRTCRRHE